MPEYLVKHTASLPERQEDADDAGEDHEDEGHDDPEPEVSEAPCVARRDLQVNSSKDAEHSRSSETTLGCRYM